MDAELAFKYWKALKAIRSNEQKSDIESTVFPHLKEKTDREKVLRSLSNAFRLNVSDGDYKRENELERILEERRGQRKNSG